MATHRRRHNYSAAGSTRDVKVAGALGDPLLLLSGVVRGLAPRVVAVEEVVHFLVGSPALPTDGSVIVRALVRRHGAHHIGYARMILVYFEVASRILTAHVTSVCGSCALLIAFRSGGQAALRYIMMGSNPTLTLDLPSVHLDELLNGDLALRRLGLNEGLSARPPSELLDLVCDARSSHEPVVFVVFLLRVLSDGLRVESLIDLTVKASDGADTADRHLLDSKLLRLSLPRLYRVARDNPDLVRCRVPLNVRHSFTDTADHSSGLSSGLSSRLGGSLLLANEFA